jgi:hypothetical protein
MIHSTSSITQQDSISDKSKKIQDNDDSESQ